MKRRFFLFAAASLPLVFAVPAPVAARDEAAEIVGLLMQTFDRPEARLSVGPVVIEGDAAVAGWTQGETGGRAFLRRTQDGWQLLACGGDALKTAKTLAGLGLPAQQAQALAAAVAAGERGVEAGRRRAFASFKGLQAMQGSTSHHPQPDHEGERK